MMSMKKRSSEPIRGLIAYNLYAKTYSLAAYARYHPATRRRWTARSCTTLKSGNETLSSFEIFLLAFHPALGTWVVIFSGQMAIDRSEQRSSLLHLVKASDEMRNLGQCRMKVSDVLTLQAPYEPRCQKSVGRLCSSLPAVLSQEIRFKFLKPFLHGLVLLVDNSLR